MTPGALLAAFHQPEVDGHLCGAAVSHPNVTAHIGRRSITSTTPANPSRSHYYSYTYRDATGASLEGETLRHEFAEGDTFTVTYLAESPDDRVLFPVTHLVCWALGRQET